MNVVVKVWAKRRFKTPLKYLRAKYKREFELNEKILSHTLWARLEPNGRLVVGAVAKKQPPHPQATTSTTDTEAATWTAADSEVIGRDYAALLDNPQTTSFPPEAAAPQHPDIRITCPGDVPAVDGGCRSSSDKE